MTHKTFLTRFFILITLISIVTLAALLSNPALAKPVELMPQGVLVNRAGQDLAYNSFLPIIHKNYNDNPAGKIVFGSYRDGNEDIYSMDINGTEAVRLTTDPAGDRSPDWSPDGTKIAFVSNRSGAMEVYVMNADGSNQTNLTSMGECSYPQWSPDGTRIAFYARIDNNNIIYTMNPDGSDLFQVTDPAISGWDPSWSPDGLRLAFLSARTVPGIYVIDAAGTNQSLMVEAGGIAYFAWSPDGQRLALSMTVQPGWNFDLFTYRIDTATFIRLTETDRNHNSVDWSPDGTHLVFHGNLSDASNFEIYSINFDGTGLRNITNNPADDSEPDWSW